MMPTESAASRPSHAWDEHSAERVGVTTSYAAAELPGAELVVNGLNTLTIPMLDRLCGAND